MLDTYGFGTEIIAASVRNPEHVEKASLVGAHIATVPASLFSSLWSHPLTDKGMDQFMQDWENFKNKK